MMQLDLKVGSRVKLIRAAFGGLQLGQTYTVTDINETGRSFRVDGLPANYRSKFPCSNDDDYWTIVLTPLPLYSEEQAVSFLTEKGYKVEAPPQPRKGVIVLWEHCDSGNILKINYNTIEEANSRQRWDDMYTKRLAVIEWTEGQGLGKDGSKPV